MCAALAFPLWLLFAAYCCKIGNKKEDERKWAVLTCYGFLVMAILITVWICYPILYNLHRTVYRNGYVYIMSVTTI